MKYYTEIIPVPLAEKLKESGMPLGSYLAYYDDQLVPYCNYAEVFDWLMEKGNTIAVNPMQYRGIRYMARIYYHGVISCCYEGDTWHEATNTAIEKALELIKE